MTAGIAAVCALAFARPALTQNQVGPKAAGEAPASVEDSSAPGRLAAGSGPSLATTGAAVASPTRAGSAAAEGPSAAQASQRATGAPAAGTAGPSKSEKVAETPKPTAGADGFALASASGDFKLQLRGYAHFDGRFFASDHAAVATDSFLLRRVRPLLAGTLGSHFDFQIMPDFGGGVTVLQDAWLDVNYSPKARLRVGKFKSPVGLERLQSATAISFVERALPTALVPNRDLGVMLHGELGKGVLAYAAGLFDGAGDGASLDGDSNDGKDVAARLFVSPWKRGRSRLQNLGFGVSGTAGRQSSPPPAYKTGGQVTLLSFAPGAVLDGSRRRLSPQLSCYSGRLGLMAEAVWSESQMRKGAGAARGRFTARAWQASATFTLTGEPAASTGVRPRAAFDPGQGRWGALELAVRANRLSVADRSFRDGLLDASKSPHSATAWGAGLNWYLTRNIKQVVDFERTSFDGGATAGDRAAENAFFIRTQLSF